MSPRAMAGVALVLLCSCDRESIEQTVSVCARGDRDILASQLQDGKLVLNFRDGGGAVLLSAETTADKVTTVPDIPRGTAVLEVRGFDASGADVAVGTAPVTGDDTCVCLALRADSDWVCEDIACEVSEDACTFSPASAEEPCADVSDGVVLDDSGPCFFAGGSPGFIREESVGWADTLHWTHTTDHDQVDNYALWQLSVAQSGRYRIEAYTLSGFGQSKAAVYEVLHGRDISRVTVDQSAVDGWNELGVFELQAGGGQAVRLADVTGEPGEDMVRLVFDALRFTAVNTMSAVGTQRSSRMSTANSTTANDQPPAKSRIRAE